jgi:putative methyltransferase|tara:strand:- start:80 stop:2107 length:2028 start_codon:yes stop_codon:yes gene_type:complete
MLNIYLGDLVYDTIKTNYAIPLNIAYLAASLEQEYADQVEIHLFKYPKVLEKKIQQNPPDILGLSHYSWNSRLNSVFIDMAKRLNADVITIMGGPNVRTEPHDIKTFLSENPNLDYYVVHEGEEPFVELVGELLKGNSRPTPANCAAIIDNELSFQTKPIKGQSKEINAPSPYLSGWLDPFLTDPNMIPLIESNRGCPFGCIYCCWGLAALSRIRQRPLEMVFREIDYIAKNSAGQMYWCVCDANFGILPRDIEIAKKLREISNKYGFPSHVDLWHSKNTTDRNIEIADIVNKISVGYIAIQSADPLVLSNSGRGNIPISKLNDQLSYYHQRNLDVLTDILIGLPGETVESHLNTLMTAFDMGFTRFQINDIRMLPGSKYDSEEFRQEYEVTTKFRPIFGAYGKYDGRLTFELEESVRTTKDMNEDEISNFKVLHWLIYFTWNTGLFKPILRYAQKNGLNPVIVLNKLAHTEKREIKSVFDTLRKEALEEWFDSQEEMVSFYEQSANFDSMVNNFMKLNISYIAKVFPEKDLLEGFENELKNIIQDELQAKGLQPVIPIEIEKLSEQLICRDLLQQEFSKQTVINGKILSSALNIPEIAEQDKVLIEIYRPQKFVAWCQSYLKDGDKEDLSQQNLAALLEGAGVEVLMNKIRFIEESRNLKGKELSISTVNPIIA